MSRVYLMEILSHDYQILLASLAGSLVRVFRRGRETYKKKLIEVFSGFATAYYTVPVIVEHYGVNDKGALLLAFGVGLVGMEMAGVFIAIFNEYFKDWHKDMLDRVFGRNPK